MHPATPSRAAAESTASGLLASWLETCWYDYNPYAEVWDPQSDTEEWDSDETDGTAGEVDQWEEESDSEYGDAVALANDVPEYPVPWDAQWDDEDWDGTPAETWDVQSDDEGDNQNGITIDAGMAIDDEIGYL